MLMQVKEEEEYLEWLKGQKQTLSKDKSIAAELVSLASFCSMAFSCCCPKKDGMLKSMCCCNFLAGSFIFLQTLFKQPCCCYSVAFTSIEYYYYYYYIHLATSFPGQPG